MCFIFFYLTYYLFYSIIDPKSRIDDDLNSTKGLDDEKEGHNFCVFYPIKLYNPSFELGILISNKTELRQAIHSHAIKTKRSINITKNDKIRVHVKCADKEYRCKLHALKLIGECTFQIRKYDPNHSCGVSFHVKNLKYNWLNVKGFRIDEMEDIRYRISNYQVYRAKKKTIEMIEGSLEEQYSLLWDYAEIKRTNPGTTGPHGRVLLTVVEVDPNNNSYPITYVVVSKESKDTWDWFLTLLKIDLNIEKDFEYTFMYDKQKGLIQAFEEVFPNSDHRFYVRHMHSNFKNINFRGQAFKSALWNVVRAATVNEFRRRMKEMRDLDEICDHARPHLCSLSNEGWSYKKTKERSLKSKVDGFLTNSVFCNKKKLAVTSFGNKCQLCFHKFFQRYKYTY
ncbi:hypothetical protein Pfo_021854 [Paulownia fortunei]|nr:hypothetical protein Pfo_021854 [Paulownia fortunei]